MSLLYQYRFDAIAYSIAFCAMALLERFFQRTRQPFLRKDWEFDAKFMLVNSLLTAPASVMLRRALDGRIPSAIDALGIKFGPATLPAWMQLVLGFVFADYLAYWLHRAYHSRTLWPLHLDHHSPTSLQIWSAHRFHVLDIFLKRLLLYGGILLLGVRPWVLSVYITFGLAHNILQHLDLPWTFGPFRRILSSPVYHRWHHHAEQGIGEVNFAIVFSLWDVLYGTAYFSDTPPAKLGLDPSPPSSYLRRFCLPFAVWTRRSIK